MTYENEILRWIKQSFRILLNKIQILCLTAHHLPKTKCNWDELDESFFIFTEVMWASLLSETYSCLVSCGWLSLWLWLLAWPYYKSNQIKSNHFYCHITTAQVPWWVKFLWACSRQCRKTTDNLPMDRQCKKNNRQFTYGQTVQKKQQTIYIWTDSAKKTALEHLQCSRQCKKTQQQQFTYGQTVQKNNSNLHMDSTYLQTVQKTMCKIHIHILSTHSVL